MDGARKRPDPAKDDSENEDIELGEEDSWSEEEETGHSELKMTKCTICKLWTSNNQVSNGHITVNGVKKQWSGVCKNCVYYVLYAWQYK